MAADLNSLLDSLEDDAEIMSHYTQAYHHHPLQQALTSTAYLAPPRDRYRSARPHRSRVIVEDDEQTYAMYQDPPFDSFDEQLLRRSYNDRKGMAGREQGNLTLEPINRGVYVGEQGTRQTSEHHRGQGGIHEEQGRSFNSQHQRAQDGDVFEDDCGPARPEQMDLSRFAYRDLTFQRSSSEGGIVRSSSPTFQASQRKADELPVSRNRQRNLRPHIPRSISSRGPAGDRVLHQGICGELPQTRRVSPVTETSVYTQQIPVLPPPSSVPVQLQVLPAHGETLHVQGIPLVAISELPDRLRVVFPYPTFNAVQSRCFKEVYGSNNNFVLASPTGSGKTVVLELAICRAVAVLTDHQYKIVYQAPTKALCAERQRDWDRKFKPLGLNCAELTGDSDVSDLKSVQNADIIITTPEKWDSLTRKWRDHEKLMRLIKLFLIDEVHMLKEDRGAILEAVVSRMKSIGADVRFVALSATVPNLEDVAAWLGKNSAEQHRPAASERFGEEFKPVRLQKHVCGYPCNSSNDFVLESILNGQLPNVITKYAEGKPIMIFCSTRKSTKDTAKLLGNWWAVKGPANRAWKQPAKQMRFLDRDLNGCAGSAVAFHHAGLGLEDRSAVERAFLEGNINVICCTSTLAVGVNLPCHMVIIKNTVTFTNSGSQEYSDLEVMQMLGRAGRPQFDRTGVAVIMTRQTKVRKYEMMVTGQEVLESTLHLNLVDHLNAEVGLGTIRDQASAKRWLDGTFLSARLKQNPAHYKLGNVYNSQHSDEIFDEITARDISLLKDTGLVAGIDCFQSTEPGQIMARYYVNFASMRLFMALQPKTPISELLSAIAQASEFANIRFRSGEKTLYKIINKSPYIRFAIPVNLDLPAHKVSLLIQSILGDADISWDGEHAKLKSQYSIDANLVFKHVVRLMRCIVDLKIQFGDSVGIMNTLMLCRSLTARVWDDSPLPMKQIDGIGPVAVRKLSGAGIRSIEDLECTDAHRIHHILNKNPPFGMNLLQSLKSFPKLRVSLKLDPSSVTKKTEGVGIQVRADIGFINDKAPESFKGALIYVCFLAETSDGSKVEFARISAKKLATSQQLSFPVILKEPGLSVNGHVMCDGIAGTLRTASVTPKINQSMYPLPKPTTILAPLSPGRPTQNMSKRRADTTNFVPAASGEFDDDSLDDEDLVKASFRDLDFDHIDNYANPNDAQTRQNTAKNATSVVPNKSKAVGNEVEAEEKEPVQLENGNWKCNHFCRNRNTCKHQCCKDGLKKPPKRSISKRTVSNDLESADSTSQARERQTKLKLGTTKRTASEAVVELDMTREEKRKKQDTACKGPPELQKLDKLHSSTQLRTPPSRMISITHQTPSYSYGPGEPGFSFMRADGTSEPDSANMSGQVDRYIDEPERELLVTLQSSGGNFSQHFDTDNFIESPMELTPEDHRSESFGEADSIFGDALVGAADSEDLRHANTFATSSLEGQPQESGVEPCENHANVSQRPVAPPSMLAGASSSTPGRFRPPAPERLETCQSLPQQTSHETIAWNQRIQKAEQETSKEADIVYDDLEPWLLREFGGVVEIERA